MQVAFQPYGPVMAGCCWCKRADNDWPGADMRRLSEPENNGLCSCHNYTGRITLIGVIKTAGPYTAPYALGAGVGAAGRGRWPLA